MNTSKLTALLLSAAAGITMITGCAENAGTSGDKESGMYTMHGLTTQEFVTEMGAGINLGNTFESCGDWITQWGDGTPNAYETAWGSPTVTKELIQGYVDAGFGVVRVPVAWSNMMADDGSYTIHPDYMARVQEVVDWILEEDLYVILNLHWDSGWLEKLPENQDMCMEKYTVIWEQITEEFKNTTFECDLRSVYFGNHIIHVVNDFFNR
jgi:endoglucanase